MNDNGITKQICIRSLRTDVYTLTGLNIFILILDLGGKYVCGDRRLFLEDNRCAYRHSILHLVMGSICTALAELHNKYLYQNNECHCGM